MRTHSHDLYYVEYTYCNTNPPPVVLPISSGFVVVVLARSTRLANGVYEGFHLTYKQTQTEDQIQIYSNVTGEHFPYNS